MVQTYFLGANSKSGFYSLYEGFPSGKSAFLHIIKGGPGTGKSGFMRRIGEAAEKRGYDVEYVLCSGDPDSLDGVYIPAIGAAWVDGTAPHIGEPRCFAVDADYVNIGRFLILPFSDDEKDYVNQISRSYKALYDRAYSYIRSAAALREAVSPAKLTGKELETLKKKIDAAFEKVCTVPAAEPAQISKRFMRAASCLGDYPLCGEISKLCKLIYQIDGAPTHVSSALEYAAAEAQRMGTDVVCCPSPVDPELLEAVLIPGMSLAFVGFGEYDDAKHLKIGHTASKEERAELRQAAKLEAKLMAAAYEKLRQAKELHDQMESIYKAHMDFPALTKFTKEEIKRIFDTK